MPMQYIHFAHANGFPGGSYNKLFSCLPDDYEVFAKDKFAHDNKYPLNDNWTNQVDELINHVESYPTAGQKVHAVGHSFGAVISYMAVCQRPDLFASLIMLDPPLFSGLSRYALRLAKKSSLIDKFTPAGITKTRASKWSLDLDLEKYFARKNLFKDFDPQCIADYVNAAIYKNGQHKELSFEVPIETSIFRTIPHNLAAYKNKLQVSSTLITAKNTNVCVPMLRRPFLKHNPTVKHIEFPRGGHMFPLEHPTSVAKLITELLMDYTI